MDGYLYSQSQFDLMTRLLDPNPKTRLDIFQSATHHWFINEKLKGGTIVQKFPRILPSLKTILELRESSSQDFNSKQDIFGEDDEFSVCSEEEVEVNVESDSQQEKVHEERCHIYKLVHNLNKMSRQKHPSKQSYYSLSKSRSKVK